MASIYDKAWSVILPQKRLELQKCWRDWEKLTDDICRWGLQFQRELEAFERGVEFEGVDEDADPRPYFRDLLEAQTTE